MVEIPNPIEVFNTLKKSPTCPFRNLWDIEVEVLNLYIKLQDKQRVGFKLPTGSGKTIIGLLIAEAWRRANKKVIILSANYFLCYDIQKKASELGLNCEVIRRRQDDPRDYRRKVEAYRNRECIGIMNYWAYLFSEFESPDVLIIDDAHEFIGVLEEHYTLSLYNSGDTKELYQELCRDLLRLPYSSIEKFHLNLPCSYDDIELLYFNHSYEEVIGKLRTRLPAMTPSEMWSNLDRAKFSLERNRDIIDYLLTFVTPDRITIGPYLMPIEVNSKVKIVNHIIFMSATLGSKETIQMNMRSSKEIHLITEEDLESKVRTMGKRLILPLENTNTSTKMRDETFKVIEEICNKAPKALIMCRSYNESYSVKKYLEDRGFKNVCVFTRDNDVENFKKSASGILITAWRFIGLDFPGDTCRLAILVNIPHVVGPIDAFNKTVIEEEGFSTEKVANRLIQAFGRCNRSFFDYAVYYIIDERFIRDIDIRKKIFPNFPAQIKAEIKYGLELCDGEVSKSIDFGQLFLDEGVREFEEKVEEIRKSLPYDKATLPIPPQCVKEIVAWEKLLSDDLYGASDAFEGYADSLRSNEPFSKIAAWNYYMAAQCHYLIWKKYSLKESKDRMVEFLVKAADLGKNSWFNKLRIIKKIITGEQVIEREPNLSERLREKVYRNFEDFIKRNSTKGRNVERTWEEYRQKISAGTHAEVCNTLCEIFELIGHDVTPKYKKTNEPDLVLYPSYSDEKYVVLVEVKTLQQRGPLDSSDVAQIIKHIGRYERDNPGYSVYPLIYTNKSEIEKGALDASIEKVRIFKLDEFKLLMNNYLKLIKEVNRVRSPLQRVSVMVRIPTLDKLINILKPSTNPKITEDDCNEVFKS